MYFKYEIVVVNRWKVTNLESYLINIILRIPPTQKKYTSSLFYYTDLSNVLLSNVLSICKVCNKCTFSKYTLCSKYIQINAVIHL